MKYNEMSKKVLENIGGINNVRQVGHCATRLRINVKDESKVNIEALKNLDGSYGVVFKDNQIQLIIGANVDQAYNAFLEVSAERKNQ